MKNIWNLWAKSLGQKATDCNETSDAVAIIRTMVVLFYIVTNFFIIAGVIRHW